MPATGRSDGEIARLLGISLQTFYTILTREKPISRATAEMLGRLFRTGEQFWLQMQAEYDRFIAPQIVVDAPAKPALARTRLLPDFRDLRTGLGRGLVHDVDLEAEDAESDARRLTPAHFEASAELETLHTHK